MKQKRIAYLLIIAMLFSLSGCDWMEERAREQALESIAERETSDKTSTLEGSISGEEERATAEENIIAAEDPAVAGAVSAKPVLGDGNADYEGFTYLYADELMTEGKNAETGATERERLVVYIPRSNYSDLGGNFASSNAWGLYLNVSLNGFQLPNDYQDKTAKENLEYIVKSEFTVNYNDDYRDITSSAVEETGGPAYRATVSYIEYDDVGNEYNVRYNTYFLKQVSASRIVVIQISVHSEEATEQTEELVRELESFYGFDIDWDPVAAAQRLDGFDPQSVWVTVKEAGLMFEIPDGWIKNDVFTEELGPTYVHAKGVTYDSVLTVSKQYSVYDWGEFEDYFAAGMGDMILDEIQARDTGVVEYTEISEIDRGNFDYAVKLISHISTEGKIELSQTTYLGYKGDYMYYVIGVDDPGVTMGAELAKYVFETARFADS